MSNFSTTRVVPRSHFRRGFLVALACALLAGMGACSPGPGPDAAVRLWLDKAQAAVESRDRPALVDMIAESYVDARGNDRTDIEQMLRVLFFRNEAIVLVSRINQVEVFDDSAASVRLTAGMAGAGHRFAGLNAEVWRFELDLEKNGGDWLLIGARWGQPGDNLR